MLTKIRKRNEKINTKRASVLNASLPNASVPNASVPSENQPSKDVLEVTPCSDSSHYTPEMVTGREPSVKIK